jgi:uncharacterized RmlC-like cupin family protein
MSRLAAIAADTVGSKNLWVGRVTLDPGARSGAHHHGDCESVVCVTAGRIRFRFGEGLENSFEAGPGDFIYIPPRLVHQELNLSDGEPIDSIVVRDSGKRCHKRGASDEVLNFDSVTDRRVTLPQRRRHRDAAVR